MCVCVCVCARARMSPCVYVCVLVRGQESKNAYMNERLEECTQVIYRLNKQIHSYGLEIKRPTHIYIHPKASHKPNNLTKLTERRGKKKKLTRKLYKQG